MNLIILELLSFVYGREMGELVYPRLLDVIAEYRDKIEGEYRSQYFDEKDAILITYGDMVQAQGERPLNTLHQFLAEQIGGLVQGVHLLPFFPYSSDDGFSVIDYDQVDPKLGNWNDVEGMGQDFRLMFDAVINHISRFSEWFQAYVRGEEPYRDYFVEVEPEEDLSAVFRPRALPLLTAVQTARGLKYVWTTFSADQIDLNFGSPDLLLDIVRVLLNYAAHGAELIRLDAIAFMWKEIGTNCLHRPRTHALIQLMRAVLDEVAPQVVLITETNVPHKENISYFGDGANEAQMVYNFSLPPLTLHAFHTGSAEVLTRWAATLELPSDKVTFFNFLASHDGVGVTPARGLLADGAVQAMAERVEALGGFVSYKNNPDGSQSAYELNINYLDALGDPTCETETDELMARRFLAAQAIMLALRGVPGIYFHSLFGSRGWRAGVQETGRKRTINRQKLGESALTEELARAGTLRQQVFDGYQRMLRARRESKAFHPNGRQEVVDLHRSVFALRRSSPDGRETVLCLQNVANESVRVDAGAGSYRDLLTGDEIPAADGVDVAAYGVLWLI